MKANNKIYLLCECTDPNNSYYCSWWCYKCTDKRMLGYYCNEDSKIKYKPWFNKVAPSYYDNDEICKYLMKEHDALLNISNNAVKYTCLTSDEFKTHLFLEKL